MFKCYGYCKFEGDSTIVDVDNDKLEGLIEWLEGINDGAITLLKFEDDWISGEPYEEYLSVCSMFGELNVQLKDIWGDIDEFTLSNEDDINDFIETLKLGLSDEWSNWREDYV